jgi:hypothetical protein
MLCYASVWPTMHVHTSINNNNNLGQMTIRCEVIIIQYDVGTN